MWKWGGHHGTLTSVTRPHFCNPVILSFSRAARWSGHPDSGGAWGLCAPVRPWPLADSPKIQC